MITQLVCFSPTSEYSALTLATGTLITGLNKTHLIGLKGLQSSEMRSSRAAYVEVVFNHVRHHSFEPVPHVRVSEIR